MLHLLFMSCQLWGSYNLYKMYRRQQRLIAKKDGMAGDAEENHLPLGLEKVKGAADASLAPFREPPHNVSREPSRDGSQAGLLVPSLWRF
jgi:hypothetical protein